MAITDTQKVDYLWKKLGYAATKTDTNDNKKAPNEAIASPLQLRADKVMKDASSIPSTQPASTTGVVTVYPTSNPIECTADGTATANRTWKTGQTDWISPEFGSTYQAKVYIHTSSDAGNSAGSGTQVFATGSGNDDEWFFDYQSGVLHFIGDNLPNGVSFTGKSVYIAASRYTGEFGVGGDLGAFTFTDNRLQTTVTNEEIIIEPAGTGYVKVDASSGIIVPVGSTLERPTGQTGMMRFNTTTSLMEVYNGSAWVNVGAVNTISTDEFDGDDTTTSFSLSRTSTTASLILSINGTIQEATNTYSVSGTTLTFNEAPATGDKIQARNFFSAQTVEVKSSNSFTIYTGNGSTIFNASSGNRYAVSTSSGTATVNLPSSPTTGDSIEFADASGAFATNNLTIGRNGNTIMGLSEDLVISTNNTSTGLFYNGSTWRIF